MSKLVLFYYLFVMYSYAIAQEHATVQDLIAQKEERIKIARQAIQDLKNGVLLVRLDFDRKEQEYYNKFDNTDAAEKVRRKAQQKNIEIIDAFKTYYKFSPVYYFDISDSRNLLEGNLDKVTFYNDSAQADEGITLSGANYFIAEFGYVEPDTISYYSGSTPTPDDEENPEGKKYYSSGKTSKPALVIRDKSFNQLREPFPYYVGYAYHGSTKKRYRLPVKKLEEKLNLYYQKNSTNLPDEGQ